MRKMLVTIVLGAIASPALAQTVVCDGAESGGTGANSCDAFTRRYAYSVTDPNANMVSFELGTDDPTVANYTSICMPPGWTFTIVPGTLQHNPTKTAHGAVSPGPTGMCTDKIVFAGPAGLPGGAFTFGFNHFMKSHDVEWVTTDGVGSVTTDWALAVGGGAGPIHAPKSTEAIPTLSEWGVVAMVLILLVAGTIVFGRFRTRQAA